jgi:hypothetical protein
VVQLVIISVLVLEAVPEFLSGEWSILRRLYCLGGVLVPCHEDIITFVFPRIQVDCKMTAERMV